MHRENPRAPPPPPPPPLESRISVEMTTEPKHARQAHAQNTHAHHITSPPTPPVPCALTAPAQSCRQSLLRNGWCAIGCPAPSREGAPGGWGAGERGTKCRPHPAWKYRHRKVAWTSRDPMNRRRRGRCLRSVGMETREER